MKKRLLYLIPVLLAFTISLSVSCPQGWALDKPVKLVFGAMPIGSSWYVYAATYSKILEKELPPGSSVEVLPQGGGIANPLVLAAGKADVAISNVATARWAYDGLMMYKGKASKNLRALAGGLNKVFVEVLIREEFIKKTGIDSLQKLADKKYPARLICKPKGSTAPPAAEMILAQYGMSFDKIKEWGGSVTQVSGGQIPEVVRDGRADIWFEVAPPGHPAITEGMLTANLKMISLDEKVRKALGEKGLYPDVIPANTWKGQTEPIRTVNPGTLIAATTRLADDVAYVVTKIICEHKAEIVAVDASIKPFDPEKAWMMENNGIPLHPGAERYYKDKGWMK
jgi:TRAP transporter TAXI family solute receptor